MRTQVGLLLAAAVVTAAAGCAGHTAPEPARPSPLSLVSPLQQSRSDSDRRLVALPVRNVSAGAVTVAEVRLLSGRFQELPPTPREDPVQPGERVDLRLPYGVARCGGDGVAQEAAVLVVRSADGTRRTVRLVLAAPVQPLDVVHDAECRQQAFARAFTPTVALAAPATLQAGTPTLPASLTFVRAASRDDLTVTELEGSRLYDLSGPAPDATSGAVAVLPAGAASASVPVRFTLPGCEAHVVSQANEAFNFYVDVRVGGTATPVRVLLPVSDELQRALAGLTPLCPPG